MIDTKDVIEFFDRLAPAWDGDMVRNEAVIARILDLAAVVPGTEVLDVACGTGVLIPDYLARGAASVTAIDVSSQMIRIARAEVSLIAAIVNNFYRIKKVRHFYNALPTLT